MTELRINFYNYYITRCYDELKDAINDFCNIYANSYEEYMAMWEILMDGIE